MALRSDAVFRDAKAKLQDIRSQQSKRLLEAMTETKSERRKMKKQKKSSHINDWT